MKTIILTTGTRKAYGDEATTAIVGVYQFEIPKLFNWAVTRATELMRKRGYIAPKDRVRIMREILARRGFRPLKTTDICVSTH